MASYSEIQKAVRVEKFRIWFAWASGGIVAFLVTRATLHIHILGAVTQIAFGVLGILATFTAVTMTNRLNKKATAARREVLGDDV